GGGGVGGGWGEGIEGGGDTGGEDLMSDAGGDDHARDLGEGADQATAACAVPGGDRDRCARLRARRARLLPLQCPAGRQGRERLLLLRGLQGPGGAGSPPQDAALRQVA